jgi:cell division septation protein DedD
MPTMPAHSPLTLLSCSAASAPRSRTAAPLRWDKGWGTAKALQRMACCLVLPMLLASCASDFTRPALSDKARVDKLGHLSMPANAIGLGGEGDDQGSDVISTQGRPDLIPTPLDDSDPLPKHNVAWLSFVNTPLQDVLQAIVADSKLPLGIVWDNPASKISRASVSMTRLSGDLGSVLDKLAESYGFYWRFKDGMLNITADRQYVAPVPPIADLFESLPIMVKTLGGTDVFLDKSARMITFRAGSQSYAKIKNYLEIMRKNRSLIVYDTYIWEVILNDGSKMGIDWGALPGTVPATAITSGVANASEFGSVGLVNGASGGNGLALSFAGSRFSMSLLIDFLRSQGTLNSLSQPKIQLLSGGRATLKDEIATTYVSRIGSPSISAGTVIPGSVETSQVMTGVTLEVSGDVSDGTIYSDISLRVSDLIGMGSATVSGSTITLPKTSSREVQTQSRAKPGDTILLAGIQYDKLASTLNSGMGIVRSSQSDTLRSELIIVMRPRIKHFVPRAEAEKAQAHALPAPMPASENKGARNRTSSTSGTPSSTAPNTPPSATSPLVATLDTRALSADKDMARGIYWQLGAFASSSNAESFKSELDQRLGWRRDSGQGLRVITPERNGAGKLHLVLAGPFADRQTAEVWATRGRRIVGNRPILVLL